jgi:DNA-binding transcriptional ArsR family regulator
MAVSAKKKTGKLTELDAMGRAAECLRTLAHPHRLRMVQMLLRAEYTVGELADACGIQSHMASEHLGRMKDRGLLKVERRGRSVYYGVAEGGLAGIMNCIESRFG